MEKLWGGRFTRPVNELMARFSDSIGFDQRLYRADIKGSIAYSRALQRVRVITADEYSELVSGLERVLSEFDDGSFELRPHDEDIHTVIERRLGELVGPSAGKLHTGRSRNDQVATDMRLYLRDEMASAGVELTRLQAAIVEKAEANADVLVPGYTHLQQAQPVLFSHWLMAFFWKFQRDYEKLSDIIDRTSVCPLGAGALAGNPLGIDRRALAADLGFKTVTDNSIDAVSDRDYLVEFLAWASLLQVHLSNLAEDIVTWSSREFGFVEVDDAYATGSSLMPQKKNPDSLELMRGKSGRLIGHLVALLTTLKALPSAYNKDLQEDKEGVFDVVDTLSVELPVAAGVVRTLRINQDRMEAALDDGLLATDLADYLVEKGVPFRESHRIVGQAVKRAEDMGVGLQDLGLAEYQAIHSSFSDQVFEVFDFRRSIEARNVEGGTASSAVRAQIAKARGLLSAR